MAEIERFGVTKELVVRADGGYVNFENTSWDPTAWHIWTPDEAEAIAGALCRAADEARRQPAVIEPPRFPVDPEKVERAIRVLRQAFERLEEDLRQASFNAENQRQDHQTPADNAALETAPGLEKPV